MDLLYWEFLIFVQKIAKNKKKFKKYLTSSYLLDEKMYWDNIVLDLLSELKIQAIEVEKCYEMDNLKEYEEILNKCKR